VAAFCDQNSIGIVLVIGVLKAHILSYGLTEFDKEVVVGTVFPCHRNDGSSVVLRSKISLDGRYEIPPSLCDECLKKINKIACKSPSLFQARNQELKIS